MGPHLSANYVTSARMWGGRYVHLHCISSHSWHHVATLCSLANAISRNSYVWVKQNPHVFEDVGGSLNLESCKSRIRGFSVRSKNLYRPVEYISHFCDLPLVPNVTQKQLRMILGAFAKLRKATTSFVTSVRLSEWNSATTGLIFMEFNFWGFFGKSVAKIKVSLKSEKNTGTLYEDQYTFLSYLIHFFLEWETCGIKVVKKINKCILCSVTVF
jgi:hypothetical protein